MSPQKAQDTNSADPFWSWGIQGYGTSDDAGRLEPVICIAHGARVMLTANLWGWSMNCGLNLLC